MICENCGTTIEPSATKCPSCGHAVEYFNSGNNKTQSKTLVTQEEIEKDSALINDNKTKSQPVAFEQTIYTHNDTESHAHKNSAKNDAPDGLTVLKSIAVASVILAFLFPLVGFILGVIGEKRSREYGGKYKRLCSAAIVISVMLAIGRYL